MCVFVCVSWRGALFFYDFFFPLFFYESPPSPPFIQLRDQRGPGRRTLFFFNNRHRDAEDPTEDPLGVSHSQNPTTGRRSSWVKEDQKVWRCVSVSEDPPPPGDTL